MSSKNRVAAAAGTRAKGFEVVRICRVMTIPGSTFCASRKTTLKHKAILFLDDRVPPQQRRFGLSVCETALQRVMSCLHALDGCARPSRMWDEPAGRVLNRKIQADMPLHQLGRTSRTCRELAWRSRFSACFRCGRQAFPKGPAHAEFICRTRLPFCNFDDFANAFGEKDWLARGNDLRQSAGVIRA